MNHRGWGNYGIRWDGYYWVVYIIWMDPLGDRHWCSSSGMLRRRSRSLDKLLKQLKGAEAVMLFPCIHGLGTVGQVTRKGCAGVPS